MKKINSELNKDTLLSLYYENKEMVLPVFAIVVSILLFIIFIIPQLLSFPSRKSAVDSENAVLNKIKESEKVLSTANLDLVNSQVELVGKTLPEKKTIEEALGAIFTAASLSNSQIESYQFIDSGAEARPVPKESENKYQSLDFSVNIFGDINQAVDFIDQLYKSYPISSVKDIDISEGIASMTISFFYSPFAALSLDDRTRVRSMSEKEREAIEEIQSWNETLGGDIFNTLLESSPSGESSSSPF